VLFAVEELSPEDVTGEADAAAARRAELDGRVRELEGNIKKAQARLDKGGDVDAIFDALHRWEGELKQVKAAREELKAAAARDPEDDLEDSLRLVRLVRYAKGEELVELRKRLRSKLRSLLSGIWVLPFDVNGNVRALFAQLVFLSGRVKAVSLVWVRRGKWAGAFSTWKLVAAEPGETHLKGRLLSEYASDPETRAWFAGHRERMTPAILEHVRNLLKTLELGKKLDRIEQSRREKAAAAE
jgi:hypothetical protein